MTPRTPTEPDAPSSERGRQLKEEMAFVKSVGRLMNTFASMDDRTTEIIAGHVALEREIDEIFAVVFPNPGALRRLGWGHKVSVLYALAPGEPSLFAGDALLAFNDLRNAVAHNDSRAKVDAEVKRFIGLIAPRVQGDPDTMPLRMAIYALGGQLAVTINTYSRAASSNAKSPS